MKIKIEYLLLLILSVFLTACMHTQSFSPENKLIIHTVTIDKTVKIPKGLYYLGPGIGYAGIISALPAFSSIDQIKNAIAVNNIKIDEIVKNHFIADLKRDTHLIILKHGKADANLVIEVVNCGFSVPQGFSLSVVPILTVDAKLFRNNSLIWQDHYRVLSLFEGLQSYTPAELIANPKLIESSWNNAAENAVKNLTKELGEN
jgi:hypothetical protein